MLSTSIQLQGVLERRVLRYGVSIQVGAYLIFAEIVQIVKLLCAAEFLVEDLIVEALVVAELVSHAQLLVRLFIYLVGVGTRHNLVLLPTDVSRLCSRIRLKV